MPNDMHNSSPAKGPNQFGLGGKPPARKGQGPGANRSDGGTSGGRGTPAPGYSAKRGENKDLHNDSPMRGPSMAGVIKYIQNRTSSGKGGPGEQAQSPTSKMDRMDSPIATGGAPTDEGDEGNTVPGESHNEAQQEAPCKTCGHTKKNKTAKRLKTESSDFDSRE